MTLRLLVIDDNPNYRLLVRHAVAGSGVTVVAEAATAEEGIALAEEVAPDVVMIDVVMRPTSGLSALKPLRDVAPQAAIVAVSSHAEHDIWGRSGNSSGVAYLSKSVLPSRLAAELERIVAAHRAAGTDTLAEQRARFPADLQSARGARHFAAATLRQWDCSEVVDSVSLLVSELVTNAIIHAHSDVDVVLHLRPDVVRVDVIDANDEGVRRRSAGADAQSGRGMALIEALATSWGIDSLLEGKSVWFELPRPAAVTA